MNIADGQLCGTCIGQIATGVMECGLDIACIIAGAGLCWSCGCTLIAGMGLPFLEPICASLAGG